MSDLAPAFRVIRVPVMWCGVTRETADGRQAWTCGCCPAVDDCAGAGVCQRARPEDFEARI